MRCYRAAYKINPLDQQLDLGGWQLNWHLVAAGDAQKVKNELKPDVVLINIVTWFLLGINQQIVGK